MPTELAVSVSFLPDCCICPAVKGDVSFLVCLPSSIPFAFSSSACAERATGGSAKAMLICSGQPLRKRCVVGVPTHQSRNVVLILKSSIASIHYPISGDASRRAAAFNLLLPGLATPAPPAAQGNQAARHDHQEDR